MAAWPCLPWGARITAALCLALSLLFRHIFFVSQSQRSLSVNLDFSREDVSNDLMGPHGSIPFIHLHDPSHFLKLWLQALLDCHCALMSSKGADHGRHVCRALPPTSSCAWQKISTQ